MMVGVLDDYPSSEKLREYCEALELAANFIRENTQATVSSSYDAVKALFKAFVVNVKPRLAYSVVRILSDPMKVVQE
jgi:hypothetical protein